MALRIGARVRSVGSERSAGGPPFSHVPMTRVGSQVPNHSTSDPPTSRQMCGDDGSPHAPPRVPTHLSCSSPKAVDILDGVRGREPVKAMALEAFKETKLLHRKIDRGSLPQVFAPAAPTMQTMLCGGRVEPIPRLASTHTGGGERRGELRRRTHEPSARQQVTLSEVLSLRITLAAVLAASLLCACASHKPTSDTTADPVEPVAECKAYDQLVAKCLHRAVNFASQPALTPATEADRARIKAECTANLGRLQVACR